MSERWSPRSILLLSLLLSDDVFNIWGEGTMKKNRLGWRQGSRRRRECRRRCGTDIEPLKVYAFVAVYNNVLVIRLFWSRTRLATCYNDRSWWFIDFVDEMIHSISSTSRKLQFTSVNFWLCLSALRETKKRWPQRHPSWAYPLIHFHQVAKIRKPLWQATFWMMAMPTANHLINRRRWDAARNAV